mgnify:CR=1 FL=1
MAVTATVNLMSELDAAVSGAAPPNVVSITGATTPSVTLIPVATSAAVTTVNLAQAPSITSTASLADVDLSAKQSGSVVNFNTTTSKWEATNAPDNLILNGGAF